MAEPMELAPAGGGTSRRRSLLPQDTRQGFLFACVDKIIVPDENDRDVIFTDAAREGNDIFFRHLKLRADGGLNKERVSEQLYSMSRCVTVVLQLGFVAFNSYTVCSDFSQAVGAGNSDSDLDFTLIVDPSHGAQTLWAIGVIIAAGEVFAMLLMVAYAIYVAAKFEYCAGPDDLAHYRIWHQLYGVCCSLVPTMTNFSAMAILSYVNPQTLGTQLSLALTQTEEGASYFRVISVFFLSRLAFALLGFLSFVIKYMQLTMGLYSRQLQAYGMGSFFGQLVDLLGFVNQLFGLCRVGEVETSRLFLFVFGGEDSQMQAGELDRQEAFLACVAQLINTRLYLDAPSRQRRWRRFVAMLSFTHLDVQSMVLDEDEKLEVDARSIRSARTAEGVRQR